MIIVRFFGGPWDGTISALNGQNHRDVYVQTCALTRYLDLNPYKELDDTRMSYDIKKGRYVPRVICGDATDFYVYVWAGFEGEDPYVPTSDDVLRCLIERYSESQASD